MTTSYFPCQGCGCEPDSTGTYHHNRGCLAWESMVGPYSTPNPPKIHLPRTVKEGWTCPNCGAGIAPWMPYCSFCKPKEEEK